MTKKKNGKKEQAAAQQHEKPNFTEEQLIAAVREITHPASSREISDALKIADPDRGRSYVRTHMQALIKDGKIKTDVPAEKSRATFLYSVAEA
jgi:predicted ArsR family transcriptional regulator